MYNPFLEIMDTTENDINLINDSIHGDGKSLEKLILRHQAWIYNISFKMVMDPDDASDITQEILIKIITNLSSYNQAKAEFRTWIYRMVVNHLLTMKKKKFECRINDFDKYVSLIENLPDHRSYSHPESNILVEELKTGCMMGMMLCLTRRDRLVFLLGAVFNLSSSVCADILEISRNNFRKILSRSRRKIFKYMNGICGVVNESNPCRCSNKLKYFVDMGMIHAGSMRFFRKEEPRIKDIIAERLEEFTESYYDPFIELFREHNFYGSPDMVKWFRTIIRNEEFSKIFRFQ